MPTDQTPRMPNDHVPEAMATGEATDRCVVPVPAGPQAVYFALYCCFGIAFLTAGAYGLTAWGIGFPVREITEVRTEDGSLISSVPTTNMVRHSWGILLVSAVPFMFVALRKCWLTPIEHGRAWATLAGYIVAALLMSCLLASIVMVALWPFLPEVAAASLSWVVAIGIMFTLVARSLNSRDVRQWLRLNGRCPRCRSWDFGIVSPPSTVICTNCHASIEFRSSRFSQRCPQCRAKMSASWQMVGDIGVCPRCGAEFEIREEEEESSASG